MSRLIKDAVWLITVELGGSEAACLTHRKEWQAVSAHVHILLAAAPHKKRDAWLYVDIEPMTQRPPIT